TGSSEGQMKFELVINLKAPKQIGLTVPPNVLVRATKIEPLGSEPLGSEYIFDSAEKHSFTLRHGSGRTGID
ncbi:MAG: hypothetical protein U1E51_19125, partial [Candidatus Binatia bacterium]|nr:hypothetical protein [Candidatus Binatia bacterium]